MTTNETPRRTIRVEPELWAAVQRECEREGTTVSKLVRELLAERVGYDRK